MMFMSVFTCSSDKRDEAVSRWINGPAVPPGIKVLGEWPVIGQNKVYRLFEADDPAAMLMSTSQWTDVGEVSLDPVMKSEEMIKLFKGMKK